MQDSISNSRRQQAPTAFPSAEHLKLESIEIRSGHTWERTTSGQMKLYDCGPVCERCGFGFAIEAGIPETADRCQGRLKN